VEANRVQCVVNNSCTLEGVQLTVKFDASARLPLPCLGPDDEKLLAAWAAATTALDTSSGPEGPRKAAGDFLALPRTRNAADVTECRAMLARCVACLVWPGLLTTHWVVSEYLLFQPRFPAHMY
jgi:hypothetical protein